MAFHDPMQIGSELCFKSVLKCIAGYNLELKNLEVLWPFHFSPDTTLLHLGTAKHSFFCFVFSSFINRNQREAV